MILSLPVSTVTAFRNTCIQLRSSKKVFSERSHDKTNNPHICFGLPNISRYLHYYYTTKVFLLKDGIGVRVPKFARSPELDVAHGGADDVLQGFLSEEGLVASDQDVVHAQELSEHWVADASVGTVAKEVLALSFVHVESCCSHFLGLETLQQTPCVYQTSS
jgi:hypothetical protein